MCFSVLYIECETLRFRSNVAFRNFTDHNSIFCPQREMSSAAESKEPEVGEMDVIGGLFEAKPGQKYPTPSPGNGGTELSCLSVFHL